VTLSQFENVFQHITGRLDLLEQRIQKSFVEVHENQLALKAGLDSAEFNIRAIQKSINAIAADTLHTTQLDGVDRVDWAKYHSYVQEDLNVEAEIQKQQDLKAQKTLVPKLRAALETVQSIKQMEIQNQSKAEDRSALFEQLKDFTKKVNEVIATAEAGDTVVLDDISRIENAMADIIKRKEREDAKLAKEHAEIDKHADAMAAVSEESGNDPEEVRAATKKLLEDTKRVAEEAGKMARGEPYDKGVITAAEKQIEDAGREDFPEGAQIFGG